MLDALVDTGRWQPLGNQFQLRMQLLFTGRAQSLFSPADVSLRCLGMLSRLARVHRSVDCRGLSFYPLPACMRLMSEPEHLRVLAQLLHVDQAAELLLVLVENNPPANSKLYLTGAFFFAFRCTVMRAAGSMSASTERTAAGTRSRATVEAAPSCW
jgi:hypothetical protein